MGSSPTARTTNRFRQQRLEASIRPRNFVGVQISGGLGNQLFQYSAGLALARRTGSELYCNLRAYDDKRDRALDLPAFGITLKEWRPTWWRLEQLAREATGGRWRPGPERLVETSSFEPDFFTIAPPCYLKGYYQNWRYFEPIADEVRRTFDTDRLATPRIAEMERRIKGVECAVAVHVRRGDYVNQPRFFVNLGRDYYDRARAALTGAASPTYFLFSDDMTDARTLLADWPNLVPVSGFGPLEDFRLMSLCRHFIMANSTFSWWAAWLGRAADKKVVGPAAWYGPNFWIKTNIREYLLPDWTMV